MKLFQRKKVEVDAKPVQPAPETKEAGVVLESIETAKSDNTLTSTGNTKDDTTAVVDAVPEPVQDYPHGLKLLGIMFGLCCSIFLVALDQTIIATASKSSTFS